MTDDVSRETRERLTAFCELVRKWNPRVNLVSRASLTELWDRHIVDSLQLASIPENTDRWADLGSGGGFPGIVVASVLKDTTPTAQITMVESDQRKSAFLRTAIRELELNATVISKRIEQCEPLNATTLSARALAPLSDLLRFSAQHLSPDGQAIFPKGASWEKEVEDACQEWSFQYEAIKSQTDPSAAILLIRDIEKS